MCDVCDGRWEKQQQQQEEEEQRRGMQEGEGKSDENKKPVMPL
jgi:hypothetical protein